MALHVDDRRDAFVHEAFLYDNDDEFVGGLTDFIREGVDAGEPVLVVVAARKIAMLEATLGVAADAVMFEDMSDVGANPARIIPAWADFVRSHALTGRRLRGIGEPIDADRSDQALRECQLHESLLNLAFDDGPPWWLVCPYDTRSLPCDVIDEARRSHPFVSRERSPVYRGVEAVRLLDERLPAPPASAVEIAFDDGPLGDLRAFVADQSEVMGLRPRRIHDLMLAVSELASNSVRHGGGHGVLRIWDGGDGVVCEIEDRGRIDDAMVGRERPVLAEKNGRGLWLVHQVRDLVQIRTSDHGTVVRVHIGRTGQ